MKLLGLPEALTMKWCQALTFDMKQGGYMQQGSENKLKDSKSTKF